MELTWFASIDPGRDQGEDRGPGPARAPDGMTSLARLGVRIGRLLVG